MPIYNFQIGQYLIKKQSEYGPQISPLESYYDIDVVLKDLIIFLPLFQKETEKKFHLFSCEIHSSK